MNYLIGLYHTKKNYYTLIGSLLASRYGYSKEELNQQEIIKGIDLSEQLQKFFLHSNAFRKSTERLSFINKKHASLIISIFYDHFMAKEWFAYNAITLESDMIEFYKIINLHKKIIPERAKKKFGRVKKYKLFENLQTIRGMQIFIYELNKNEAYNVIMQNSLNDFMSQYNDFKSDFQAFLEELTLFIPRIFAEKDKMVYTL
jgi:acyl carrier protein phosphodiesterase